MVNRTITSGSPLDTAEPRGGRIGVAFDWGLGVQIASTGLLTLVGLGPGGGSVSPLVGLGMLAVSALPFAQGEALRRGNGIARSIQLFANGALTLGGVASLYLLVQRPEQASNPAFWYTLLLLLVVSPLEVWLLLQPGSRNWYGLVSSAAARARHSGPWLTGTVAWAVACGLGQTLATYLR